MGYIFESEIDAIINAARTRAIGEEESITLRKILVSDIHPAIKAYFKAEVEKHLKQERALEIRSKKFPYAHPEIGSLQRQIDILLIYYYEFARHEFDSLLDEAVHFQFNFLCRPQWTLVSFIFGSQRRVATSEIENKLKYCVDYTYFVDLIKRYTMERGLTEVTYEEFAALVQKIDYEVVSQHTSLELARMTRALFAFVDAGTLAPHGQFDKPTLPINAAIVFFEDKHLDDIKARLELERDKNSVTQLTVSTLADIIEKVRTGNEQASVPEEPAPSVGAASGEPENGQSAELTIHASGNAEAPPQTLPAREHEKASETVTFTEITKKSELKERPSGSELQRPVDVHTIFSKSDQKLFVRSIFNKDEDSFRDTLDKLNAIETWEETSHYLDTLFGIQNVDPFSSTAVRFTDRIYSRFHPSE